LAWNWIFILCYFFTAISIVCDRGEGHPPLRAGTTLSLRTKASPRESLKGYTIWLFF
jgi:hypothetical protein